MSSLFLRGLVVGTSCTAFAAWAIDKASLEARIHVEYDELQRRSEYAKQVGSTMTSELFKYGLPLRSPDFVAYRNHALCYDQQKRIPHWVAEHITKQNLIGIANRKHSQFRPDSSINLMFSAQNSDYYNSGWSRGHMVPAGDCKFDQDAMSDTFYLSNIVPQDIDNNAGFWNRFEMYCRDLTNKFDHVRVFSGPLFLPYSKNGKRKVKYEVIGSSEVAVPTHLFKVVVAENNSPNDRKLVGAFVVPNKPISREHQLKEYQVPLEFIESKAGFVIMPLLDRKQTRDLCRDEGCAMISWEKFELYFITRKLESANTLNRLENVWKEVSQKGIQPDKTLISIYNSKRKELEGKEVAKTKQ